LRVVGYINGEQVAERHCITGGLPHRLVLQADDDTIFADGADMTRISCVVVDKLDNRLPYANVIVTFAVDGPAELVGENPFALPGGQGAIYLKAQHDPGTVTVTASALGLKPVHVLITTTIPE